MEEEVPQSYPVTLTAEQRKLVEKASLELVCRKVVFRKVLVVPLCSDDQLHKLIESLGGVVTEAAGAGLTGAWGSFDSEASGLVGVVAPREFADGPDCTQWRVRLLTDVGFLSAVLLLVDGSLKSKTSLQGRLLATWEMFMAKPASADSGRRATCAVVTCGETDAGLASYVHNLLLATPAVFSVANAATEVRLLVHESQNTDGGTKAGVFALREVGCWQKDRGERKAALAAKLASTNARADKRDRLVEDVKLRHVEVDKELERVPAELKAKKKAYILSTDKSQRLEPWKSGGDKREAFLRERLASVQNEDQEVQSQLNDRERLLHEDAEKLKALLSEREKRLEETKSALATEQQAYSEVCKEHRAAVVELEEIELLKSEFDSLATLDPPQIVISCPAYTLPERVGPLPDVLTLKSKAETQDEALEEAGKAALLLLCVFFCFVFF
jgi:hypothetical protein